MNQYAYTTTVKEKLSVRANSFIIRTALVYTERYNVTSIKFIRKQEAGERREANVSSLPELVSMAISPKDEIEIIATGNCPESVLRDCAIQIGTYLEEHWALPQREVLFRR